MKFLMVDEIIEFVPDERLRAVKALSAAEEYLADHFPKRPLMPGVLMLEAMVQAGAWLERLSTDFAHSMVLLREAQNIKYGQFVTPGSRLEVDVKVVRKLDDGLLLQCRGQIEEGTAVRGRIDLVAFNLVDRNPHLADVDEKIKREMRALAEKLRVPARSA